MKNLFSRNARVTTAVDKIVNYLTQHAPVMESSKVSRLVTATESLDSDLRADLSLAAENFSGTLVSMAEELGIGQLTAAQEEAATIAGMMANNYRAAMSVKREFPVSTESMAAVQPVGLADAVDGRSFALEAYDERENKQAVQYSMAYNMQTARQDEFGETFWPTLVTTPDNVGFGITVNLMMVFDAPTRKVTGTFEDFKKKNIIRAVADPTVLRKEQTRITPVYRDQAKDKFVDAALIPASAVLIEGESIMTAPLAVGKKVDLLGLSQTDALLAKSVMDNTDTLDPAIVLKRVYLNVGKDVLGFDTLNLPTSAFTYATQGNYRLENLNFTTNSILVNKDTKNVDGSALQDLAAIVTSDLIVRLEVSLAGNVNIETGETNTFPGAVHVYSVQDADGQHLPLDTAPAAAIVALFEGGKVFGWEPLAYRTNMNRRQRGQLIDVTKYTQLYNVPLRSPITALHPMNTDGQTDASDVQALITTTRIRTNNEAVTALLNTQAMLKQYVDARDVTGIGPDLLGVGRFFVRPVYSEFALDMKTAIDSIKAQDRAADIQAVLVNKIRDMVFRMYRDSEYKAAADALAGGISQPPTVILGTDPVLARYLMVTGDLRTIGGEFDVRVVQTLDNRVQGKIFIAFGVFNEERNSAPNPLGFGNMIWAPELVLTANISRGDTISKETVVQPRYLFVTHTPILGVLTVDNVPDVLNKVPLYNHVV